MVIVEIVVDVEIVVVAVMLLMVTVVVLGYYSQTIPMSVELLHGSNRRRYSRILPVLAGALGLG